MQSVLSRALGLLMQHGWLSFLVQLNVKMPIWFQNLKLMLAEKAVEHRLHPFGHVQW